MRLKYVGRYRPGYVPQLKMSVYLEDEIEIQDEPAARELLGTGEWDEPRPRKKFLQVLGRK